MTIAFDFDGTLKRGDHFEHAMWCRIVRTLQQYGRTVIICSMRAGTPSDRAEIDQFQHMTLINVPVVFVGEHHGDGFKRSAALAAGYKVDVWVDDQPESICAPVTMVTNGGGDPS